MSDPIYGLGYPGNLNKPSMVQVVAAIDPSGALQVISGEEITGDMTTAYIPRETMQIQRTNEDGSTATFAFDVIYPTGSGPALLPHRYVHAIDILNPNGLGGFNGLFAGYIIESSPVDEALEKTIHVQCVDYGILAQEPPEPIETQWPPGEGTPVVDSTVAADLSLGSGVVFHPENIRHLYVGKRVYAANSDGSNREYITISAINTGTGDVTADFASDKTSTTTTVAGALHGTGLQTITPASMTNINVGSIVYCKKHHGVQDVGNEWVVVTAVTSTTFDAYFTAYKTHDWEVQSYWALEGGITDKELIADGWQQTVDLVDPTTGLITSSLVAIESLIDHCYTAAGMTVDTSAVGEYTKSLPHGKWEGPSTPTDVLNWVVTNQEQDVSGPTKDVHWYFTFVQPAVPTELVTLPPQLRYYSGLDDVTQATVSLINTRLRLDATHEARFVDYQVTEDGRPFYNYQAVKGANSAWGYWQDSESISNPLVDNYVGRRIPAKAVVDQTLLTNAECSAKATLIAHTLRHSNRHRSVTVSTYAQADTFIVYQPFAIDFHALLEPTLPGLWDVHTVTLSFTDDGLAKYEFELGEPSRIRQLFTQIPTQFRKGVTQVNALGKVTGAWHGSTKYVFTHDFIYPDADLYVADTSDGPFNLYLPTADQVPGHEVTVKVPADGADAVTVYANTRDGRADSVDGAPSVLVQPGQSITLRSTGEHDRTARGTRWEATGRMPAGDPWLTSGNVVAGDAILGLNSGDGSIFLNIGDYDGAGLFNWGRVDAGAYPALFLNTWLDVEIDTPMNPGQGAGETLTAIFAFSSASGPTGSSNPVTGIEGDASVNWGGGHSTGQYTSGVTGFSEVGSGKGVEVDLLQGVSGAISHHGTDVLHTAATISGQTIPAPSGGGTIEEAISVWGQAQSAGSVHNWAGRFDGDVLITGKLVGPNASQNLPIASGAVPSAGMYVPILTDFACTIVGVHIRFYDASGDPVNDTAAISVRRTDWATDTSGDLNSTPFGPTADVKYESDATIFDNGVDIAQYDSLQVRLDTAPASAVALSVSLEVVRA